jgi:hypothetical protein
MIFVALGTMLFIAAAWFLFVLGNSMEEPPYHGYDGEDD